jgi:hypothetical protein
MSARVQPRSRHTAASALALVSACAIGACGGGGGGPRDEQGRPQPSCVDLEANCRFVVA